VPHSSKDIETKLQGVLEDSGLRGWTLVLAPDSTQPNLGKILPETKVIIIHDEEPEGALRTLLHEILELRLRASSNMERSLSNVLIRWANEQIYKSKEMAIEELLDLIFALVQNSDEVRDILKGEMTN